MKANETFLNLLTETEERNNLTVIDYSEGYGCILAQHKKTGKAHYIYSVNEDMSFDFSLLCEVGEPFKPTFKRLLQNHNLIPVSTETETDYFEVLRPKV